MLAPVRFEAYQSQHGTDVPSHHSASATVAAGNNPALHLPRAAAHTPNAVVMNGRVQTYHHGRGEPPLQIVNR